MRRRDILHKSKLDAFKAWLTDHGIEYRDGRGAYQILQVYIEGKGWQGVHEKDKGDHYTIHGPLLNVVKDFVDNP